MKGIFELEKQHCMIAYMDGSQVKVHALGELKPETPEELPLRSALGTAAAWRGVRETRCYSPWCDHREGRSRENHVYGRSRS
ncbi:MAG TPA: hypothetical protein VK206_07800 [Anaerolineales bacterium]|nr:hypothetical protein [Anaerolineales bacterium]